MASTASKTVCPISRSDFHAGAKALTITIDGKPMLAGVKEFSTGGLGWYLGDKVTVVVNGVPVKCQVSLSIVAIGSKELPKE